MKRLSVGWVAVLAAGTGACVNEDVHLFEVELAGRIATEDPSLDGVGTVHLELHHGYVGEGELRRPLGLIESWALGPEVRDFEDVVLVSTDGGAEGLVMYGWLDLDGDGVLCNVGSADEEPAGVVVLSDVPAHDISFELELSAPCRGVEPLFP